MRTWVTLLLAASILGLGSAAALAENLSLRVEGLT